MPACLQRRHRSQWVCVDRAADLSYAAKDKWEVDRDTVELISQLGEGQYGEVYKGGRALGLFVMTSADRP